MRSVKLHRLGLISYKEAWDYQVEIFKKLVQQKIDIRNGITELPTQDHLIICEHPHVYTLGKSGSEENLLLTKEELENHQIDYFKIDRGGDITYHGPGQLVVYPIFDLDHYFTDLHKYMRFLEEAVILTIHEYSIKGERFSGMTGVWLDPENEKARKICALGVKCSRWITMHGIGFNINTDLNYFKNIIPCGIDDKAVTSMEKELGKQLDFEEVTHILLEKMALLFEFKLDK